MAIVEPCGGQQTVTAPGGVAVGGNVVGSTVNIGIPQEQLKGMIEAVTNEWQNLSDQQKKEIDTLSKSLSVKEIQLVYIARRLGVDNVGEAELGPALMDRVESCI